MATPPNRPDTVIYWGITQVYIDIEIRTRGNGGAAIVEYQLGYGTSPSAPEDFFNTTDKTPRLDDLEPATLYYIWSRARNSAGWSSWSPRSSQRTKAGVWVKINGSWRKAVPYVRHNGTWKVGRPYVKNRGFWEEASSG